MAYLGLGTTWSGFDPQPDPVPTEGLKRLREVLVWLYGSKEDDKETMNQSQNLGIKHLSEILESGEGLHILRAGGTSAVAHRSTRHTNANFSESLIRARSLDPRSSQRFAPVGFRCPRAHKAPAPTFANMFYCMSASPGTDLCQSVRS